MRTRPRRGGRARVSREARHRCGDRRGRGCFGLCRRRGRGPGEGSVTGCEETKARGSLTCGIMAKRDRRSCSLILEMSSPSMWMLPDRASRKRNKARVSDDLPAPVRPTTPIRSFRSTLNVRPLRTGGRSGAYPATKSLTSIRPSVGHAAGGLTPSSASVVSSVYYDAKLARAALSCQRGSPSPR